MPARLAGFSLVLLTAAAPALLAQQGRLVTETEPNDDIAHAQSIQLGDTISGTKVYRNIDFFGYDLPANTIVVLTVPEHGFCAGITFYDRDGRGLAGKDCHSEQAPNDRLAVRTTAAGRYYVSIVHPSDIETPGDEGRVYPYKLRLARYEAPPPGLGNPLSLLVTGDQEVTAMVATPDGDMIVAEYELQSGTGRSRLRRVTPDGQATTFATDVNPTGQIAIDAFGDLLVPSWDEGGVVWRYDLKTGARTIFTGPSSGPFPYHGVTIGADGDVWLSMPGGTDGAKFSRFDALGTYKSQVAAGRRTFQLTTAQNGELLFVAQDSGDVYRLITNTTPVRVITAPSTQAPYGHYGQGGLAIDRDGWIYLYQHKQGKLLLFNAQYQLARDPLAQVLDSVGWKDEHIPTSAPAWMRDRNGKMTSRLLVARAAGDENTAPGQREILEVNHTGMGAPGADPMLHLKKKSLRNAAVNVAYADTVSVEEAGSSSWSLQSGQLPAGLSLSTSGILSGTPTTKGTFAFAVRGANGPRAVFGRFSITVGDAPPVQVSENDIANALMGGAALPTAMVEYLDNLGNNNGRLDVGDFRAYLRSQGQLSGVPKP